MCPSRKKGKRVVVQHDLESEGVRAMAQSSIVSSSEGVVPSDVRGSSPNEPS